MTRNGGGVDGGAMCNLESDEGQPVTLINVTLTDNRGLDGGGMYNGTGAVASVSNSIIWGNKGFFNPDNISHRSPGTRPNRGRSKMSSRQR